MAVLCCRSNDWPAQSSLTDKFAFVYDYCVLNVKSILGNLYHLFLRLFAIVFAVATAVILWSELLMASSLSSPIGLLLENLAMGHTDFMAIQTIALLSLAYMSICTYWSLFRLNLGAMYSLQGPQLSLTPSLIFNAQYFSRLQFALGYNFIIMLNINGYVH